MQSVISSAILTVFPYCLAVAAFTDLFTMSIPNRVSIILLGAFVLLASLSGMPWQEMGLHFAAAAIVFAACFAGFALNIMGGGDAKLLTASAIWFGLDGSLGEFIAYVAVMGGVLALVILAARSQEDTLTAVGLRLPRSFVAARKIPYGIAIATGGFLAFPSSSVFETALLHI